MNISLMIFIIVAIFIFGIIAKIKKNQNNNDESNKENIFDEMEELFIKKIQDGYRPYKLLYIYFQMDLMLIKSLLQAGKIPYHVEFEHFHRIKLGIDYGFNNVTTLYIIENNYNDAKIIIENYFKNRKEDKNIPKNITENVIGDWMIQSPKNTNGIEIIYKKK
jgi:hypothetical protein